MYYQPVTEYDSIEFFIKNVVFDSHDSTSVDWVLSKPKKIHELAKCTSVPCLGFKQFAYDRNIIAFSNGFLAVKEWIFTLYDNSIEKNTYAKVFFDVSFQINWLTDDWTDIQTPYFDHIWSSQVHDHDALLVAFGLLGQLHYSIDDNNFQIGMYIKGTPNSGKSTVIQPITLMFPVDKIGSFDHKQKIFGMASLLQKFVCIDQDTPHDMVESIGKTEFQKLISGEHNVVPQKGRGSWEGVLNMHTLICSNYMQDVKEAGEIQRRLAVFVFNPVIGKDASLQKKILKETSFILIKTLLAYRELKYKYKNKTFEDWGIEYFDSQKEESLYNNNPVYKFIDEDNGFSIEEGAETSWTDFEIEFKTLNRGYRLKTTDQTFARLGLEVRRNNCCRSCFKKHAKGCCDQYQRMNKTTKRVISNLKKYEFCVNQI
jgi:hypothetical protein